MAPVTVMGLKRIYTNLVIVMKKSNSLKTLKKRSRTTKIVRRKGRVYVIDPENPRFKARQG